MTLRNGLLSTKPGLHLGPPSSLFGLLYLKFLIFMQQTERILVVKTAKVQIKYKVTIML